VEETNLHLHHFDNLGYTGAGVRIAILDTGVNGSCLDLQYPNGTTKVIDIADFTNDNTTLDLNGHGTIVSIIAAGTGQGPDLIYIPGTGWVNVRNQTGMAPYASILNIKVMNRTGQSKLTWVLQGLDRAVYEGADVVNLSLGKIDRGGNPPVNATSLDDGTAAITQKAEEVVENGIVVIVAAGNGEVFYPPSVMPLPKSQTIYYPATGFNVITVGAIDANGSETIIDDRMWDEGYNGTLSNETWSAPQTLWVGSSRGPTIDGRRKPDVVAPGAWFIVYLKYEGPTIMQHRWLRGTSFAAPHVSGAAALLLEAHPDWTPNLVKDALRRTARLNTNLEGLSENDRGKGIIDAFAAVQSQPDGTFGWDPYQVRSMDKATVVYNVTRVENVPSLTNIQITGFQIVNVTAAPYLWLEGQEYKLTDSLLVSGPRVYVRPTVFNKTPTCADLTFVYNVNGVNIQKIYYISKTEIRSFMSGFGEDVWTIFIWLDYWDLDLHGPDHDYVTWTNGSIIWNEAKLINTVEHPHRPKVFHYNDTQHFQPWIRFSFEWWGELDITRWILRYHGGFSNNPDNYLNGESIYDTNLVIYQKSGSMSGPIIEVITQDMALPNKSFEDRVQWGSPPCSIANWTNGGGWQEPRCDVNGNGKVDLGDVGKVILAYSGQITDPDLVARCDVNCNGHVDLGDVGTVQLEYSGTRTWPSPVDGLYTWFTDGGGDYLMWQELDSNAVSALAGHTVMFSFWFYPETTASDGSENNARAEIYYEYDGGSNILNGTWIQPTEPGWWYAYVTVSLPSNLTKVHLRIHGAPNFKAWIDLAQLYLIQ